MSSQVDPLDGLLNKLLDHGRDFLRVQEVTPALIRKIIQWDLASSADFEDVASLISDWQTEAATLLSPLGSRGGSAKKQGQHGS